ncbi:MAG TPA: hypothetical protein VFR15_12060 [Chloroflexia bacterium]|nr:hypothetical protein [Chloroflexia bacterium]
MDEVTKLVAASDAYDRVKSLTGQTPIEKDTIEEALQVALSVEHDNFRAAALGHIVRAYLAAGMIEQAKLTALAIPTAYEKTMALGKVVDYLLETQQSEYAIAVLNATKDAARSIVVLPDKAQALAGIAEKLKRAGARDHAYEAWEEAIAAAREGEADPNEQYSLDSSAVALQIAETIAAAGDGEKARQVALAISNKLRRAQALARLDSLEPD